MPLSDGLLTGKGFSGGKHDREVRGGQKRQLVPVLDPYACPQAPAALARRRENFVPAPSTCAIIAPVFGWEGRTMNLRATNEQREEALWCVFLMFVVMALIIVRTGVVCRSLAATLSPEEEPQDGLPESERGPPSPDDLYRAVVAVLYLAEVAGRLLIAKTREVWELMNEPSCRPAPAPRLAVTDLCDRPWQRLDTS
jgi:hypothetical protein